MYTLILAAVPGSCWLTHQTGLRRWRDKIDGYSFTFPESWFPVSVSLPACIWGQTGSVAATCPATVGVADSAWWLQSSGNDVFFRNPSDVEENLFVSLSSPSTSKLQGVADLGNPQAAAARTVL